MLLLLRCHGGCIFGSGRLCCIIIGQLIGVELLTWLRGLYLMLDRGRQRNGHLGLLRRGRYWRPILLKLCGRRVIAKRLSCTGRRLVLAVLLLLTSHRWIAFRHLASIRLTIWAVVRSSVIVVIAVWFRVRIWSIIGGDILGKVRVLIRFEGVRFSLRSFVCVVMLRLLWARILAVVVVFWRSGLCLLSVCVIFCVFYGVTAMMVVFMCGKTVVAFRVVIVLFWCSLLVTAFGVIRLYWLVLLLLVGCVCRSRGSFFAT